MPLAEPLASESVRMGPFNQTLSSCTMLIVEDNPVARFFLRETLGKKYPALILHEADNGRRGCELFCELRPDIVFTDLLMPEMDGIGMVRQIRELVPRAQIIVGTAHSETDLLLDCISIGVSRYLLKPFRKELLFEAVDDCLSRIELERKVKSQQEELRGHRDHLELLVSERTAELELRNR